jgi:hypothetical protein
MALKAVMSQGQEELSHGVTQARPPENHIAEPPDGLGSIPLLSPAVLGFEHDLPVIASPEKT